MQALDPRLRREEQLRALYRLPILARVPKEGGGPPRCRQAPLRDRPARAAGRALARRAVTPHGRGVPDAARDARGARRRRRGRSILITGPSPSEGKTTTAINLAASLALAGNRVILIEADLRRPTVGEALGVRARGGSATCCSATWRSRTRWWWPRRSATTSLLLVDRAGEWLADKLSLPAAAGSGRGREATGRLRHDRLAAADRGDRRAAAGPPGRRRGAGHAPRLQPHHAARPPRRAARPVQHQARRLRVVGGAAPEESSYYREAQRRRAAQSDWLVNFEQKTSSSSSEQSETSTSSAER